jgi:hypothetical protein
VIERGFFFENHLLHDEESGLFRRFDDAHAGKKKSVSQRQALHVLKKAKDTDAG